MKVRWRRSHFTSQRGLPLELKIGTGTPGPSYRDEWRNSSALVRLYPGDETGSRHQVLEWTTDLTSDQWGIYEKGRPIFISTNGKTTIYARAVNGAGTKSEIISDYIKIDQTIPTIEANIITADDGKCILLFPES